MMDPFVNLKKQKTFDVTLCLICQEHNEEHTSSSQKGFETLQASAKRRLEANDCKSKHTIEQILKVNFEVNGQNVKWHRKCYSSFTSNEHIKRLEKKNNATSINEIKLSGNKVLKT